MISRNWFASACLLFMAGCSPGRPEVPFAAEPPAYPEPVRPQLKIDVVQANGDAAILRVRFPETWRFGARVKWTRNEKPYPDGVTQAASGTRSIEVITALPPDTNPDPFAEETVTETWGVEITPRHWLGQGDPVTAQTQVRLSRGCEVFHPGWVYVGCRRNVVFSVPLTEPANLYASSPALYLGQFIERHFLARPGNPGHDRFRAFINLVGFSALETTDVTLLPHDPATYLIDPQAVISAESRNIFDRVCLEIPLVSHVCLHAYVTDVDNERGGLVLDYGPEAAAMAGLQPPPAATDTTVTPASYGDYDIRPLGGNRYEVALRLHGATGDLLFEPPIDPDIIDLKNDPDAQGYDPAMDLSTYVKSYGHANVGTPLEARFEVAVPSNEFNRLDFTLLTVATHNVDFQFIFRKGPYCNSNLGTTETPAAGQTHSVNPGDRPFNVTGAPMFAGLVSDTASGAQGGGFADVLRSFYNRMTFPYPHIQSDPNGGSGVGRDRIGINAGSYEFDPAAGRFSDNPNNCVRPADACLITSAAMAGGNSDRVQDGGPEWLGNTNTSSCEWPNISNNGDDATYKISEQITSIIPYLQGEITYQLLHGAHRNR